MLLNRFIYQEVYYLLNVAIYFNTFVYPDFWICFSKK